MYTSTSEINPTKTINFCVIIPTYNNQKTLSRVINSVLEHTSDIIIVNDGSTDTTFDILNSNSNLTQIHFPKNIGKGMALRKGFQKAISLGYDYAITIDSDGQHFPSDIPLFVNEIANNGDALLIGSRNMTQEDIVMFQECFSLRLVQLLSSTTCSFSTSRCGITSPLTMSPPNAKSIRSVCASHAAPFSGSCF